MQTRQDFTKNLINTLQTGADNLVLADTNEEGANMLALQTRQQLSTTALSLVRAGRPGGAAAVRLIPITLDEDRSGGARPRRFFLPTLNHGTISGRSRDRSRRPTMALKVELKPGERILIGECVVTNGDQRTRLLIEGEAPILREKDIMTAERAEHAGQAHLSRGPADVHVARSAAAPRGLFRADARHRAGGAERRGRYIEDINNHILTGELYKALKEAKKLIAYEEELLTQCNSAAQAYGTVAKQTASPRELEARPAAEGGVAPAGHPRPAGTTREQLDEALLYNRKLWSIFLTSVTTTDNPLPADVRQNVANLGIFVMNQTLSLMAQSAARAARAADQHQSRARRRPDRPLKPSASASAGLSILRDSSRDSSGRASRSSAARPAAASAARGSARRLPRSSASRSPPAGPGMRALVLRCRSAALRSVGCAPASSAWDVLRSSGCRPARCSLRADPA